MFLVFGILILLAGCGYMIYNKLSFEVRNERMRRPDAIALGIVSLGVLAILAAILVSIFS